MRSSNLNSKLLDDMGTDKVPDIILVRKIYDQSARRERRTWKLKRLIESDSDNFSMGEGFEVWLFLLEGLDLLRSIAKMRALFKETINYIAELSRRFGGR